MLPPSPISEIPDYRFRTEGLAPGCRIYAPSSVHESLVMGAHSIIWRYTTVLDDVVIGADCILGTCLFIGAHCRIGDGTRIHHGASFAEGSVIGAYVYIGTNVTFVDSKYVNLRDKSREIHRPPVVEHDASIGCGALLMPGVVIGAGAIVGAGSVVTRDVKAGRIVAGNPARPLVKSQAARLVRAVEGLRHGCP